MLWYLLRVGMVLFWHSWVGKRATPHQPFRVRLRAWPWRCDAYFHLNNAVYLRLAEDARWAWTARTPLLGHAYKGRWKFLVGGADLVYRRPIPLMSSFEVVSRILGGDDRWLYLAQEFVLPNGQIACRAIIRATIRGKEGTISPRAVAAAIDEHLPESGLEMVSMEALTELQLAAIREG